MASYNWVVYICLLRNVCVSCTELQAGEVLGKARWSRGLTGRSLPGVYTIGKRETKMRTKSLGRFVGVELGQLCG